MDLSQCSKSELIAEIELLQFELDQLRKAIIGPRSERYTVLNTDQSSLFAEESSEAEQEVEAEVVIKEVKKKKAANNPSGRKCPPTYRLKKLY